MKNSRMEEIGKVLSEAESILVFTHLNMDADAVGSSCALVREFRRLGKKSWVLFNDSETADNLRFMIGDLTTDDPSVIEKPDVCLVVDASETTRFPRVADKFLSGKIRIAVDHHEIKDTDWEYNYIDPSAGAAGELVLKLFDVMGITPERESAEALFAAISSDTGNFQYNNTTKETFLSCARLCDFGIRPNTVSNALYECVKPEKLLLQAEAVSRMEFLLDGKIVMSCLTEEMYEKTGAVPNDGEGIVAELRSIKGVEVAVLLKEENGKTYGSFRAKNAANVRVFAELFGGGGHDKAAGCTIEHPMKEAYPMVREAAIRHFSKAFDEMEKAGQSIGWNS